MGKEVQISDDENSEMARVVGKEKLPVCSALVRFSTSGTLSSPRSVAAWARVERYVENEADHA